MNMLTYVSVNVRDLDLQIHRHSVPLVLYVQVFKGIESMT